jgi:hypothetical protein
VLVARIGEALAGKGPAGTHYQSAAGKFAEAQRHWHASFGADCGAVGICSAMYGGGLAVEDCVIAHHTARNAQLRSLEADYFSN